MEIPLDQFEQIIDESILKRGLSYFKKGAVTDFSQISNGSYEAIVSGTEDYLINFIIENNTVVEHLCECPYDIGPVCKHIVAAIFFLKQNEWDLNNSLAKNPLNNEKQNLKKKKTKSPQQLVKELLKVISHEELTAFVGENCKKDKKFANFFLASFGHLNQEQSKEFYQKQFQSILKVAAGRDGWLGRSEMKYVIKTIQPFLENAAQYLQKGNFENVFFMSTALLEEMTYAFQYGDDSDGDLGYFVESAMDFLSKLVEAHISKSLKQEMFEYCIKAYKKRLFDGWDWDLGILRIAGDLADNEVDADIILNCMEGIKEGYEKETAQSMTLELLRKYKSSKDVAAFIDKNISNPKIRNQEIERAIASENFKRAIDLAKDGIKYDQQKKPGLVGQWYDCLLEVALAQKDKNKIIEYARYRLIDSFGSRKDYYKILKDNIDPDKWRQFLEEIIKEVNANSKWGYPELVRKIYIKEKWWDRLFLLLKQNVTLENIWQNEEYLAKDYSNELVALYRERILVYLDRNVGRSHYITACKYLRRMKKLGGNEKVIELIELLRKKYPNRKALLEELTFV